MLDQRSTGVVLISFLGLKSPRIPPSYGHDHGYKRSSAVQSEWIALTDHDCCAGFALVGMEMTVYITCSSPDPVEMPFFCSLGYSGYTGMFMDMPLIQGSHTRTLVSVWRVRQEGAKLLEPVNFQLDTAAVSRRSFR